MTRAQGIQALPDRHRRAIETPRAHPGRDARATERLTRDHQEASRPSLAPVAAAAAVMALSLAWTVSTPLHAQAPQACALSPAPNTLLSLMNCCKADLTSNPSCRVYDSRDQYVIVKDNAANKPAAYLIIPTQVVTGIEAPQVLAAPVLDFWEDAWFRSRTYPGQPEQRTGLAINSATGRDQNQRHIHISCVRPDVLAKLKQNDAAIGVFPAAPVTLQVGPHGNSYEVVKVAGLTGANSPFKVIQAFPGVPGHMALQSIAVIRSQTGQASYYVLNTYAHGSNRGSAEELLDQACTP